jgi:hypothetical protein
MTTITSTSKSSLPWVKGTVSRSSIPITQFSDHSPTLSLLLAVLKHDTRPSFKIHPQWYYFWHLITDKDKTNLTVYSND